MKSRCLRPTNKYYHNYGGRGIKICDRWLRDFAAFYADMGPKPTPEYSIDRIDVNGDYTPDNCRWATHQEQVENMRGVWRVTIGGVTTSVSQLAKDLGVTKPTATFRLKHGRIPGATLSKVGIAA